MKINKWEIREGVEEIVMPKILNWIKELPKFTHENDSQLDLTFDNIAPYHLWKLLENLGYEKDDMDRNGWQQDFWLYMTKENCPPLVISACGMTQEVVLNIAWEYKDFETRDKELAELFSPIIDNAIDMINKFEKGNKRE